MDFSLYYMKKTGEGGGAALHCPPSSLLIGPCRLVFWLAFVFSLFSADFSIFDETSKRARGMNGHLGGFSHIITSVIVHE